MREVWARVVRLLAADDPETGRLVRLLLSLVLAWSLVVAEPDRFPALMWSALGVSMACWLAFVLLDGRFPRVAVALLAAGSAVAASVSGSAESAPTVFVFAMLLLFAAHMTPSMGAIVAVTVTDLALMAGSLLWWEQPRSAIVVRGTVVMLTVLFALQRRQYRQAQHDRARAMALDERTRIARELHDVLAHSLGALGVQLEVAEAMLTERGDVAGAVARVRRARALAREGLVEARSAVAALREDVPPLPDALSLLVTEHRRDHDVPAELRTTGTRRPITPAAEVCLLRTAREALTNAAKHAPGEPVTVEIGYGEGAVRLMVRNPYAAAGAAPSSGHGLQGMRERLALAGGTLNAGPSEGLWEVRAEVPE
ncbi:sensor histidine kinase [Nonomuraea sp. NPDC050451]|uniref:sensor histidine kinase n=1 Tax=Nonomuraea sp. NPDC050451 TaxID=3364364 RepID=UPI0037BC38F2